MSTLTLQPDATAGVDTLLWQGSPTTNFGTLDDIRAGEINAGNSIGRSLLKFDLSSIPAGATVTSATLSLWLKDKSFASAGETVRAYRVKRAWVEAEATWTDYSTGNAWGTLGAGNTTTDTEAADIGSISVSTADAVDTKYDFTLTAAKVQEWVSGAMANNGLLLRGDTELDNLYLFYSSDHATAGTRPKLVVNYTAGAGLFRRTVFMRTGSRGIAAA